MSTFDPNLEPPGEWQTPYDPPPPGPTGAGAAVSVYVWLCAGVGLVMSGCCVLNAAVTPFQSQSIIDQLPPDLPPELQNVDWDQVITILSVVLAILYVVVLLLPAIALAILGFGVRKGHRGQTIAATGLVWLFAVLAGLGLVITLLGLISVRPVIAVLLPLLFIGGWLWLSLVTISKLRAALQSSHGQDYSAPWGH